ncbi:MAG: hypothetical protein NVSMB51_01270 [Solirubrobacteraceae bacterium]
MNLRMPLPVFAAVFAIGIGGPAAAIAADSNGDGAHGDTTTQVEVGNVDQGQQGQAGVDEADGQNNDLATQVENANVDEGQVGDGSNGDTPAAPIGK